MKRRTVIGIGVLATMLSICTVSADYDKEIIFRDIPWGSNVQVVEKAVSSGTWLYDDDEETYCQPAYSCAGLTNDDDIDFVQGISMDGSCYYSNLSVGGYEVEYLRAYYAYTFPDDEVKRYHRNTSLYGARYDLEFTDVNGAFDDLSDKLCGLYGDEFTEREITSLVDGLHTIRTWKGLNDTYVSLHKYDAENASIGNSTLDISYAWLGGDELLKRNNELVKQAAVDEEKNIYGNGDTSGL